ncbi:alkaline phosphatase PafA [Chryseobacterium sp. SC28]|uniref:alkaline phosphatase PafA n=1 Tax=Chryseobacterium sp. SC28 TaxID=2268028 RepID=UPI000F647BB4|nr:alkaline phosphatase PafA [Chryseobacterium sp. SC28]RRQ45557.1 alkaline phosphatase family protein [Chryseobacterium sp. SC28]
MFRKIQIFVLAVATFGIVSAQKTKLNSGERPKLVVGLVVDQMRWDYLYRFEKKFGQGGFQRLLGEGYSLNNVHIPYIPTVTAIGHASIYTGSVPSIHGIAGNDWTDRDTGKNVYCTTDDSVNPVGTNDRKIGSHSPKNLWSTTVTDQLRIASNFRSKVVGVSLKDRASILPAGHNPTGAFWFDDSTGNFVTSSYYMNELPKWVTDFNNQKISEKLLANGWQTALPIAEYTESTADNAEWENPVGTAKEPVFPYKNLLADYASKKGVIRTTPFGNTLTLKFAEAALDNYALGKGSETDFLAINLASTDYVGHSYGPNSIEVEDTYIRLDQDLATFFKMLDEKVGKNNYLVFLSADHGAANAEGFLKANKILGGFFDEGMAKNLGAELEKKYANSKLVLAVDNYQIYLNQNLIKEKNLDEEDIKTTIINSLNRDPRVLYAVDLKKIGSSAIPEPIKTRIINGYNWQRSGDIQLISHDGMLPNYAKKGTTHSVWNSYDSHIPLIFMGWGIKHGESNADYNMTDIAPTISALLHIEFPSGNIGKPIAEVIGR